MAKVILIVALLCAALLLIVTALLVYLNWSPKVWAPLLSAIAVGLVTVIIAIFSNLKDTDLERVFASSVVIDNRTRLPVLHVPTGPATIPETRLMDLGRLAQPIIQKEGKAVTQFQGPTKDEEIFSYYGELLQYYVLKQVGHVQRMNFSYAQTTVGVITRLNLPPKVGDLSKVPGSDLQTELAKVRFASTEFEQFHWKNSYTPLPRGTTISLDYEARPQRGQVERHSIRVSNRILFGAVEMFSLDLNVEPIGMTGPGQVPSGISIQQPMLANCRTVTYRIRLMAHFDKLTSSNEKSEDYQRWAQWLFDGLQRELQD